MTAAKNTDRVRRLRFARTRWVVRAVVVATATIACFMALLLVGWSTVNDGDDIFRENRGGGSPEEEHKLIPGGQAVSVESDGPVKLRFRLLAVDMRQNRATIATAARFDPSKDDANDVLTVPTGVTVSLVGLFQIKDVHIPVGDPEREPWSDSRVPEGPVVDVELWGNPLAFPDDRYGANNIIVVRDGYGWPSVGVDSAAGMPGFDVYVATNPGYLNFLFERPLVSRIWAYVVACAPLLVILLLTLLHARDAFTPGPEVGIAVLTLLPLRQVLVPADVGPPTRIDLVLGSQLLFLLLLMLWSATAKDREPTRVGQLEVNQVGPSPVGRSPQVRRASTAIRPRRSFPRARRSPRGGAGAPLSSRRVAPPLATRSMLHGP